MASMLKVSRLSDHWSVNSPATPLLTLPLLSWLVEATGKELDPQVTSHAPRLITRHVFNLCIQENTLRRINLMSRITAPMKEWWFFRYPNNQPVRPARDKETKVLFCMKRIAGVQGRTIGLSYQIKWMDGRVKCGGIRKFQRTDLQPPKTRDWRFVIKHWGKHVPFPSASL